MDDTAYTVGTPTDDPELLEQCYGNLEDADASASQVYAPASRRFQGACEFLDRVKSARGYFLVVGIGAFDGLAQPSTDRKHVQMQEGQEERKVFFSEKWKTDKCCVDKCDIVLQNVPTKGNRLLSHLENVHLVPMLWVVQCSIPRVIVQLLKKSSKIKTRRVLKILLRFQSRVWRVRHS